MSREELRRYRRGWLRVPAGARLHRPADAGHRREGAAALRAHPRARRERVFVAPPIEPRERRPGSASRCASTRRRPGCELRSVGTTSRRPSVRPARRPRVAVGAGRPGHAVDEGSFTVTRRGEPVGREEFRIVRRRPAAGAEYVARALAALRRSPHRPQRSRPTPPARPSPTRSRSASAGRERSRAHGQIAARPLQRQMQTPRGESAREYLARRRRPASSTTRSTTSTISCRSVPPPRRRVPVVVAAPQRRRSPCASRERGDDQRDDRRPRRSQAQHLTSREPGGPRSRGVDGREGRVLRVEHPRAGHRRRRATTRPR